MATKYNHSSWKTLFCFLKRRTTAKLPNRKIKFALSMAHDAFTDHFRHPLPLSKHFPHLFFVSLVLQQDKCAARNWTCCYTSAPAGCLLRNDDGIPLTLKRLDGKFKVRVSREVELRREPPLQCQFKFFFSIEAELFCTGSNSQRNKRPSVRSHI